MREEEKNLNSKCGQTRNLKCDKTKKKLKKLQNSETLRVTILKNLKVTIQIKIKHLTTLKKIKVLHYS